MSTIFQFGELEAQLHAEKFLWVPSLRLLCVSDLHLEKGSFFGQFATFLPPYDTVETLERLESIITKLRPKTVIALGDSFHDKHAGSRLEPETKHRINALVGAVEKFIWIIGNHDPEIDTSIKGERHEEFRAGDITFRHMLAPEDKGFEVSGHFHPKAKIRVQGHTISGPCFVQTGNRLIMPSFGSYTGGLSIASRDFTAAMPEPLTRFYLTYLGVVHALPGHLSTQ